ncbi:MAG: DCC1-like thiol-disulfide oxidoreductase family protein [Terracidiphilus sp.]|jgi:predicted DCC family thiol-disulfide oxidoreductase YuxK
MNELGGRVLVIFDGHCGLCNRSVRWLLRRDKRDRMRFVASESPKVAGLLARLWGAGTVLPDSIVVVRDVGGADERALVRSQATLALLGELPRPWPWVAAGLRWIPRVVRDGIYRLIARWRFRIWGRLDSCPLPTAEERGRIL